MTDEALAAVHAITRDIEKLTADLQPWDIFPETAYRLIEGRAKVLLTIAEKTGDASLAIATIDADIEKLTADLQPRDVFPETAYRLMELRVKTAEILSVGEKDNLSDSPTSAEPTEALPVDASPTKRKHRDWNEIYARAVVVIQGEPEKLGMPCTKWARELGVPRTSLRESIAWQQIEALQFADRIRR